MSDWKVENPIDAARFKSYPQARELEERHQGFDEGAKAQAKKLVKWGEEECKEHDHTLYPRTPLTPSRFSCYECRQTLHQEVLGEANEEPAGR